MQREAKKYLYDIQQAVRLIREFTDGETFADYQSNGMMRAAVEREFEIIGEAMTRLARVAPQVVSRISEYEQIISFRNILIHGYADVNDRAVWFVIETDLPTLGREIDALLAEGEDG